MRTVKTLVAEKGSYLQPTVTSEGMVKYIFCVGPVTYIFLVPGDMHEEWFE